MSVTLPGGLEGEPGECRSCHARVVWVRRTWDGGDGRRAPYDLDGRHHNATCPDAGRLWNGRSERQVAGQSGER